MADRERNAGTRRRQSLSVSMVLGTLLVPLSAFAASMLVSNDPPVEPSASVAVTAPTPQPYAVSSPPTATIADLEAACGDAGLLLVTAETAGSITDVQQAALTALREICAEQGLALPGKPVPEPIVQTVVVSGSASTPSVAQGPSGYVSDDDHDDDDHDDDEDDD
jgi:hypothetical protein